MRKRQEHKSKVAKENYEYEQKFVNSLKEEIKKDQAKKIKDKLENYKRQ